MSDCQAPNLRNPTKSSENQRIPKGTHLQKLLRLVRTETKDWVYEDEETAARMKRDKPAVSMVDGR